MSGSHTRSLDLLVKQAHRAKGIRYPTGAASQNEYFKTWYSYALRQGEASKITLKEVQVTGKASKDAAEVPLGGRTYL